MNLSTNSAAMTSQFHQHPSKEGKGAHFAHFTIYLSLTIDHVTKNVIHNQSSAHRLEENQLIQFVRRTFVELSVGFPSLIVEPHTEPHRVKIVLFRSCR